MVRLKSLFTLFILISYVFIINACAVLQLTSDQSFPTLEKAVKIIAKDLMRQVRTEQGGFLFFNTNETLVVIDPFVNAESNEVLKASADIENMINNEGKRYFRNFNFVRMTSKNLRNATYAMNGIIGHLPTQKGASKKRESFYKISASIVNLKTGEIVGHSDINFFDKHIDLSAASFYKDSPMYIKDVPIEKTVKIAKSPVGTKIDKSYYESLETIAILVEAETAYEKEDYKTSLRLLKIAENRPDGQLMKTYAGLYSAYYHLRHMDMAARMFNKLLDISVTKRKQLNVKFLFDVNSIEFWGDPGLKQHYDIWLRQIGMFFNQNSYCIEVVGHCSRSGTERYNEDLSLERAQRIQKLLEPEFPLIFERSRAVGKGFKENIVGTGTDDEQDVIDRRVEFLVINCDNNNTN